MFEDQFVSNLWGDPDRAIESFLEPYGYLFYRISDDGSLVPSNVGSPEYGSTIYARVWQRRPFLACPAYRIMRAHFSLWIQ